MPAERLRSRSLVTRLDRRLASTAWARGLERRAEELRHRPAPTSWSSMFGVVSMACLTVLVLTGVFLTFFYEPSSATVRYRGSYRLLSGVEMSAALESTLAISFDVRGGLLVRQAHHWAALVLPASLVLQLLTTFFSGAFRRPRQWAWVLLFGVFVLALAGGWSGYALPDDMLSGTGLRIVQGVLLGVPFVGTWLSSYLFGGEFPGQVLQHLYPLHVLVVPAGLTVLVALRIRLARGQRTPQAAGPGRTETNVVGPPAWPTGVAKTAGLFAITTGVLLLMAGTLTISPIWLYGPSSPGQASAGSQPDWYTGFLDGALRLVPPGWEVFWLGRTWTLAVIVPLVAVTAFLALVAVHPFLEARVTGDHREHHLLDRPRDAPRRTALGAAGVVFYGTLWAAGSADLLATQFTVSFESVIWTLRAALVLGPVVAYLVTRRACLALQQSDLELAEHGVETGVIRRLASGEYREEHQVEALPPPPVVERAAL